MIVFWYTMNKKEAEKNLKKLFKHHKVQDKLTIEMVKKWVLNEKGDSAMDASNRYQKKALSYFKNMGKKDSLFNIVQAFMDAWNHFPHKWLDGKSPYQVFNENSKNAPIEKVEDEDENSMPDVIVGGRRMSYQEHQEMLKQMEKAQEPFRKWWEKDAQPKYEKYLNQKLNKKSAQSHSEAAYVFFDRAMYVGFINLEDLRPDFVQKDFPLWWQTHVMMSSWSEKQVLASIKKLFSFLSAVYDIDISRFGF